MRMTVRDYIVWNKEKFLGYKVRIWDCDDFELLTFRMTKETNIDNIRNSLIRQLIDADLINITIYDDGDDDDPQLILTSNCEL